MCQGRSIYKKSLYTTPFYVYIYTEFQIHENLLTIISNITSSDASVPYITSRPQNILLIEDHLSQIPQV